MDPNMIKLKQFQSLSLEEKVMLSQSRIRDWYNHWNGMVYIAFSGGKDSTVLLDLVRDLYPEVPAVFNNTGLEYPEILAFVRSFSNVITLSPRKSFQQCCLEYGFPAVSKEVSHKLYTARHAKVPGMRELCLLGRNPFTGKETTFHLPKKWLYLEGAEFQISDLCCRWLKKLPAKNFERESGRHPILGVLAAESSPRTKDYVRWGCNRFGTNRPRSHPMGFWTEQDVLRYIVTRRLQISSVYGEILEEGGILRCSEEDRTGCTACPFGQGWEHPNKFQRMAVKRPKLLKWILDDLKMRQVLDATNIPYSPEEPKCS